MKKILLSIICIIIFVFSIISLTIASDVKNSDLQISRITSYEKEDTIIQYSINIENLIDKDMGNLKVTVFIPELNIRESTRRFDLDNKDELTKKLILALPEDVKPGEYIARITISNDNIRRVKHRYLEVR